MAKAKKAAPKWGMQSVFPTEVMVRDWDNAPNEALKSGIWRDRAQDPAGLYRSNQAGTWHSSDSIMNRLGDSGDWLRRAFGEGFMTYARAALGHDPDKYELTVRMSAWAMVYSDRGYAAVHTHPNCHMSGVYYVDDNTDDESITMATGVRVRPGDIEFLDTRRGGEFQLTGLRMNPSSVFPYKTGRMLIFPSSLPHYVHPVRGDGERISVACNATFHLKEIINVPDK